MGVNEKPENLILELKYDKKDNTFQVKNMVLENIYKNKANLYINIFTDGSKSVNKNGIGIHFKDTDEVFLYKVKYNLSIKTLEIMAIELAIKLATLLKQNKVVIYTDSLSAITSLFNTIKEKKNKYIENNMINFLKKNK